MVIAVSENGWTSHELAVQWIQHFDKYTKEQTQGKYRLLILDGHLSHASLEFVQYCEDNLIMPLCLPPYSTHLLQPFDVSVFGPLLAAYKRIIREQSLFGAERVTNEDFLTFFQLARASMPPNIPSAWRKTRLKPFNPDFVLQQLRPTTPPNTTVTDGNGAAINITLNITVGGKDLAEEDLAARINNIAAQIQEATGTPVRRNLSFLKQTCLIMLAERNSLSLLNQSFVKKAQETRMKKARKAVGDARVLTVQDILEKQDARDTADAIQAVQKQRAAALRGKVGFAKLVWKEFRMGCNVFE